MFSHNVACLGGKGVKALCTQSMRKQLLFVFIYSLTNIVLRMYLSYMIVHSNTTGGEG